MNYSGYTIIETLMAVKTNKKITPAKPFLERLFDPDPTHPLWHQQHETTIVVDVPAMYLSGKDLIIHPSLKTALMDAIKLTDPRRFSL